MAIDLTKEIQKHGLLPLSLQLNGWQPLVLPYEKILTIFFSVAGTVALGSYLLAGTVKHFSHTDRLVLTWWVVTGIVHFIVEGWVVINPRFIADVSGNPLSEIWKEYANADSRYASRDPFTICMEFVTAFLEGPACFLVVYGLVKKRPWRHVLQLLVATCQIYGDILYFATSWYEGWAYTRPEFLYFWCYFVLMNLVWIFIPSLCALRAGNALVHAVSAADRFVSGKQE